MTTIAYRRGVLAADTLCVTNQGQHKDGYCTKIAKNGPFLACGSGTWPLVLGFLDWFRCGLPKGSEPQMEPNKEEFACCHIFRPDGLIITYTNLGWSQRRSEFYAIGSGSDYAYGAFYMGASAEQAVRAAMEFSPHTGGDIQTLRHDDHPTDTVIDMHTIALKYGSAPKGTLRVMQVGHT